MASLLIRGAAAGARRSANGTRAILGQQRASVWYLPISSAQRKEDEVLLGDIDRKNSLVLQDSSGKSRILMLNRPEALNALNLPLLKELRRWFHLMEDNEQSTATVIVGRNLQALCAGGDIKFLHNSAKDPASRYRALHFFHEEYCLNYLMATSEHPFMPVMNGITMGGGVGISAHCKYPVATDDTVFAMPECAIGFFPDVGASYLLPRLQDGLGMYLALTGRRLQGSEVMVAGIAKYFLGSVSGRHFVHLFGTLDITQQQSAIERELLKLEQHALPTPFLQELPWVAEVFGSLGGKRSRADMSVQAIMDRLRTAIDPAVDADSPKEQYDRKVWAQQALKAMEKASPLSLEVTNRMLLEGATKSYQGCFRMEFQLAQRFMEGHDFFEGVRAQLIDKDRRPKWKHRSVKDVHADEVEEYFTPKRTDRTLYLPTTRRERTQRMRKNVLEMQRSFNRPPSLRTTIPVDETGHLEFDEFVPYKFANPDAHLDYVEETDELFRGMDYMEIHQRLRYRAADYKPKFKDPYAV